MSLSEDVDESASDCWRCVTIGGCIEVDTPDEDEISSVSEELPIDKESGLTKGMRLLQRQIGTRKTEPRNRALINKIFNANTLLLKYLCTSELFLTDKRDKRDHNQLLPDPKFENI